ncbi:MAG: transcriptional repressor [Clostridia bacterium]|nr:transcriptional repressor [Clostridia bacterium]
MRKQSHQRDLVLSAVKSTYTHPTAADVYDIVRQSEPTVSLATVYRNLALLRDLGEVKSFKTDDGVEHFDGRIEEHQHFRCLSCGTIYDAFLSPDLKIEREMEHALGCKIEGYVLLFYGKCKNCKAVV